METPHTASNTANEPASEASNPGQEELERILESARRLGVEMDEAEALQWMTAMAATLGSSEVALDERSGVYGHRIVLLDFSPQDLARFRQIGSLVEIPDRPGVVETALALSGSSAQSRIQTYPGDCDYFERVNIYAPTRQEACQILADVMRQKSLETLRGPTYQLIEVKFGSFPFDAVRGGQPVRAGAPVAWVPQEIINGQIDLQQPDGVPVVLHWEDVAAEPGWCKLDWVVADPQRGQLSNASNMLDVTWQAPDGTITPLDGYLDPYFQEVYLDAESIPIFSKLVKHVDSDALDDYVAQLEKEVRKYLSHAPYNYGKAAKRMYNVFRLTGRYEEAAYLRELFDEPAALLYQVWSLIRTIDDCFEPGSPIPLENVLAQADNLILSVVRALEGDQEGEVVRRLLRLRALLSEQEGGKALTPEAEAARAEVINIVNNFFYEKMSSVPEIKSYMEAVAQD